MSWIPVSQTPPPEDQRIWCLCENGVQVALAIKPGDLDAVLTQYKVEAWKPK